MTEVTTPQRTPEYETAMSEKNSSFSSPAVEETVEKSASAAVSGSPLDLNSSRSYLEKKRVVLSWIACSFVCFLLVVTKSQWPLSGLMSGTMLLGGLIFAFIGCVGRIWCSLYIDGFKTQQLVMCGPYSVCRNPLYFFSALGAIGVAFATAILAVPVIVAIYFTLYYSITIRDEERRLADIHGSTFADYCSRVPAFFPRWRLLSTPDTYLIYPKSVDQSTIRALWFVWFAMLAHLVYQLHQRTELLPVWITSP